MPFGAVILCPEKTVEITTDILHVNCFRAVHPVLRQPERVCRDVCFGHYLLYRVDGAQHVGDMGYGYEARPFSKQLM